MDRAIEHALRTIGSQLASPLGRQLECERVDGGRGRQHGAEQVMLRAVGAVGALRGLAPADVALLALYYGAQVAETREHVGVNGLRFDSTRHRLPSHAALADALGWSESRVRRRLTAIRARVRANIERRA